MDGFCKHECTLRGSEACALREFGSLTQNGSAVLLALGRGALNHHNLQTAQDLHERLEWFRVARQEVAACVTGQQAELTEIH